MPDTLSHQPAQGPNLESRSVKNDNSLIPYASWFEFCPIRLSAFSQKVSVNFSNTPDLLADSPEAGYGRAPGLADEGCMVIYINFIKSGGWDYI
jgi:hypothetical protein